MLSNEFRVVQAGEDEHLYVTAYDGQLTAKLEVYVNILNSTSSSFSPQSPKMPHQFPGLKSPPGFMPNFNARPPPAVPKNPPAEIANNPPPMPSQPHFLPKTERPAKNSTTLLRPVKVATNDVKNELEEETTTTRRSTTKKTTATPVSGGNTNNISPLDQAVKSDPDLTVTIVPIISVCAIFLMVGIIAIVFRKKIHLGKPKAAKDDMVRITTQIYGVLMKSWKVSKTTRYLSVLLLVLAQDFVRCYSSSRRAAHWDAAVARALSVQ